MMPPIRRVATALLLAACASPAAAQENFSRYYRWYVGAQAGAMVYRTNAQSTYLDPSIGIHMVITKKRIAGYFSAEQSVLLTDAVANVVDEGSATGLRDVYFNSVRRLSFGALAYPMLKRLEPYLGFGFSILQVLNPSVDCSGTTANSQCPGLNDQLQAQDLAEKAASTATAWFLGGVQFNLTNKLAFFGQAEFNSAAKGFLLDGVTSYIQGGVRYAIGPAREDVTLPH